MMSKQLSVCGLCCTIYIITTLLKIRLFCVSINIKSHCTVDLL